jgi:hypothetical protein
MFPSTHGGIVKPATDDRRLLFNKDPITAAHPLAAVISFACAPPLMGLAPNYLCSPPIGSCTQPRNWAKRVGRRVGSAPGGGAGGGRRGRVLGRGRGRGRGGGRGACGSDFFDSPYPEAARLVLKLRARTGWLPGAAAAAT